MGRTIKINLTGPYNTVHAIWQHFKANGGGRIVNVSSVAGKIGGGLLGTVAYASSKAGLNGFTKAIAKEGGKDGIAANAVAPSFTHTSMTTSLVEDPDKNAKVIGMIPLGRAAEPVEIAQMILFFGCDAASFITGEIGDCDGGHRDGWLKKGQVFMSSTKKAKKKFSIPGGNIIIPMFIGACINFLFPSWLKIGGFTTPLAQGSGALVGAFLFVIGGSISFRSTGAAIKRGGTIILTKVIVAVALGLFVGKVLNNNFLGLSALAIIGAMSCANNAMYAGIVHDFGDNIDEATVGITILAVGPYITMIALASSGLSSFSLITLVATILPLLVGIVLANLFPAIKKILNDGMNASIVVVGFALGCTMNFQQIFTGGLSGILLGFVGSICAILADKLTGGSGVAGAAISSCAGANMATPAALAAVDASYKSVVGTATAQITTAVVVTAILTPILTAWIYRHNKQKAAQ